MAPLPVTPREIALSALFIALGLAVPVLFHAVGLGSTFLPMFLPILAAGLMQRAAVAGLIGLVTPMLSALLTGMPPLAPPIAFIMATEGLVLGTVSAICYRRMGWHILASAFAAVCLQRLVMACLMALLAPAFGIPAAVAAFGALVKGLPGVGLLVIAVPLLVKRLEPVLERNRT